MGKRLKRNPYALIAMMRNSAGPIGDKNPEKAKSARACRKQGNWRDLLVEEEDDDDEPMFPERGEPDEQ